MPSQHFSDRLLFFRALRDHGKGHPNLIPGDSDGCVRYYCQHPSCGLSFSICLSDVALISFEHVNFRPDSLTLTFLDRYNLVTRLVAGECDADLAIEADTPSPEVVLLSRFERSLF